MRGSPAQPLYEGIVIVDLALGMPFEVTPDLNTTQESEVTEGGPYQELA
jgi:hypothetical protein